MPNNAFPSGCKNGRLQIAGHHAQINKFERMSWEELEERAKEREFVDLGCGWGGNI
jgi:hypothetical protein